MSAWLWIMIAVVVLLGVLNLVVRPRRRRQDEPDLEAQPETDG